MKCNYLLHSSSLVAQDLDSFSDNNNKHLDSMKYVQLLSRTYKRGKFSLKKKASNSFHLENYIG
jgi:hypothetical protein